MSTSVSVPAPTRARMQTLEAVRASSTGGGFDADAWHVMEERDNALISDEILNGSGSSKFVYSFDMGGTEVAGISVVGARHLAAHYGGIKHRIIGSVQKIGSLFTFTSYPQPGMPMAVQCSVVPELEDEGDFYGAIVEVTDIKTGNSIQTEKRESRLETRRNGTTFERPHYPVIAQSKAYRNAVLALIPQDVQLRWKLEMLKLHKNEVITASVIEAKRTGVLQFAAAKGLTVDRAAISALTMPQISGLSEAARVGQEAFLASARALHVMGEAFAPAMVVTAPVAPQAAKAAAAPAKPATPPQTVDRHPPPPRWIGYLVDENGEMIGEDHTDHLAYAQALAMAFEGSQDQAGLLAANAEWLADIEAGGAEAASIVRSLRGRAGMTGDDRGENRASPLALRAIEVPNSARGGPAWPPYVKALKESLATVSAEELEAWAEINLPTILTAPDVQRLTIVKIVSEHAGAVGGKVPGSMLKAIEKPPAIDRDQIWADNTVGEIAAIANKNEMLIFAASATFSTPMQRLRRDKPDLAKLVDDAKARRTAELDAAPPPHDPDDTFPGDRP